VVGSFTISAANPPTASDETAVEDAVLNACGNDAFFKKFSITYAASRRLSLQATSVPTTPSLEAISETGKETILQSNSLPRHLNLIAWHVSFEVITNNFASTGADSPTHWATNIFNILTSDSFATSLEASMSQSIEIEPFSFEVIALTRNPSPAPSPVPSPVPTSVPSPAPTSIPVPQPSAPSIHPTSSPPTPPPTTQSQGDKARNSTAATSTVLVASLCSAGFLVILGGALLVRRRQQQMGKKGSKSSSGAAQDPGGGTIDPLKAFAEAAAYHAGTLPSSESTFKNATNTGSSADLYGPYGTLGKEEAKSEVEEHDGSQIDISDDDEDELEVPPPEVEAPTQKQSLWGLVRAKRKSLAGHSQIPTVELLLDELELQVIMCLVCLSGKCR
jgi:hypothetical protein